MDANGSTTLYAYGSSGKLSMMTDPVGNSEHYCYDAGNRLSRITDRNGTETTYTYNMYESILSRRAKNPAAPETELVETYQYTPEGLLQAAISTTGMRYRYKYDVMAKDELSERIYRYFDEINADPIVYHWTYKMDEFASDEAATI